jgi:hypothetical protein
MQTTKRVEGFRHCGRPVSAEKLRVLAMKVKKVVLVYISIYPSNVEHILEGFGQIIMKQKAMESWL